MIPIATTHIRVLRLSEQASDQEPTFELNPVEARIAVASGIRANIGSPSGNNSNTSGDEWTLSYRIQCDTWGQPFIHTDRIQDEVTGVVYDVEWIAVRTGLGIDHYEGVVHKIVGRP